MTFIGLICMGLFARIEYQDTINLRCHGGEIYNNCGQYRAAF